MCRLSKIGSGAKSCFGEQLHDEGKCSVKLIFAFRHQGRQALGNSHRLMYQMRTIFSLGYGPLFKKIIIMRITQLFFYFLLSVWNVSGCLNGSAAVLFNPSTAQASQISELKKCTHTHGYSVFSCLTTNLFLEQKQQQKEKEKKGFQI